MHDQTIKQAATPATGTVTSAAAATLAAAMPERSGFIFTNKSSYDIYMRLSGTATASNWTRRIASGEAVELWLAAKVTPSIIGTDASSQAYETMDFVV